MSLLSNVPNILKVAVPLAVGGALAAVLAIAATSDSGEAPATRAPAVQTATPTSVVEGSPAPAGAAAGACPAGWTHQDNQAMRYRFCTPPGWKVEFSSRGPFGLAPTPVGGQPPPESPLGSLAKIFNPAASLAPRQAHLGLPSEALINIEFADLGPDSSIEPCTQGTEMLAGQASSVCVWSGPDVPNGKALRWVQQRGQKLLNVYAFVGSAVASTDEGLVQLIVGTIEFY